MSTISIEMPLCLGPSVSVRASTPHQRAYWPHETHVFEPLSTKWSSCSVARVRSEARSEPASGSLKPWHQISSAERIERDVAPALLVVAEAQQRRPEHVEPDHVDELRRARGGELLVDDDLLDGRPSAAAELAGPRAADEAGRVAGGLPLAQHGHPVVKGAGERRADLRGLGQEAANLVLERPLLIGSSKLHELRSYQCSGRSGDSCILRRRAIT